MTNNVSHKDKKPSKNIGDARLLEIFSLYSLWCHVIFINFYMIYYIQEKLYYNDSIMEPSKKNHHHFQKGFEK